MGDGPEERDAGEGGGADLPEFPGPGGVEELLSRADDLARWVEVAIATVQSFPARFADLDLSGLELGLILLRDRLIPEARAGLELPLVGLLCGGTNVGKSTLVNSLAGRVVSESGSTASKTKRLIGLGSVERLQALVQAHPAFTLRPATDLARPDSPRHAVYRTEHGEWPDDLPLLLDTPDIDSSDTRCREATRFGLRLADFAIWVTTQQKYKDESGIRFLNEAMALMRCRFDVFNQALPRHTEALEDMVREYGERWPENERTIFRVAEHPDLSDGEGLLPPAELASLRQKLVEMQAARRRVKSQGIWHALHQAGGRLATAARSLVHRQREWRRVIAATQQRFEQQLFDPLRRLPGHEAPFELQGAIMRVLGPRIQTPVGDLVSQLNRSAGDALAWTFRKLSIGGLFGASEAPPDPVARRDDSDLQQARQILENARYDLLEFARERAESGHPLLVKFHQELKAIDLPTPEQLAERLDRHFREAVQRQLLPVIVRFETDLERFCDDNPALITAMKAVVPGFAALAGLAAAVLSIQTMTFLPGATEYLLGGLALPVFDRLKSILPANLLEIGESLAREPFIQRAREDFAKTRRAIFLAAADWLYAPVAPLLTPIDLRVKDVGLEIARLQDLWKEVFRHDL
ncbi:MAG: putative ABC transporter [Candidatus Ozemobacter sibiricus]|jgi:energy-coupling factor transporter ATP-binding protein EcfA2|uniref:Putative ABC transporter n=1 Tax=Candidatus Ozemobacter sibiricus TaxID=2268124 RepID=A0A367ZSS7_9BACT|nr:MAG: putative ABC transporter [Candidatus Ozemobacter sibiricus]